MGAVPVYACDTLAQQYRKPFERGWVVRWMWGGKAKARYAGHLFLETSGAKLAAHCGKHRPNWKAQTMGGQGQFNSRGHRG